MKMKAVLSVLLLAALTGAARRQIRKKYIFVDSTLNWIEAQKFCRKNYIDIATIRTGDDSIRFQTDVGWQCYSGKCWIGQRWNQAKQKVMWSDVRVSTMRYSLEDPYYCVFVADHWYYTDCNTALKFVCYVWDSSSLAAVWESPYLVAVQEMKTWEEALNYCRMNYTDLMSLDTESDQTAVNIMSRKIQTPYFWTGLRFLDGSWFWVNQNSTLEESLLSDMSFMPSCPAPGFRCGAQSTTRYVLEVRDCEEKLNFICYNGTMN